MSVDLEGELFAYVAAGPAERAALLTDLRAHGAALLAPLRWIHLDLQDDSRLALEEVAFAAIAFEAARGGPWDSQYDALLVRVHDQDPKAMQDILFAMDRPRAVALLAQILMRRPTAAALLVVHPDPALVARTLAAFEQDPRAAWLELPADAVRAFGNTYAQAFVRILEAATRLDKELARSLKLRFKRALGKSGRPSRAITVEPSPS